MLSERVQAARKKAQNERIAAKTKKGYVDTTNKDGTIKALGFFASQQQQKTFAAKNEAIRKARIDHVLAVEDLAIAEIDGGDLNEAKEAVGITALIVQNLVESKQSQRGPALTAAGGV